MYKLVAILKQYIGIVGSQIILSKNYQFKIAITHVNTNIYIKNPFSLKWKITRQTSNNFTIIKSITIILMYISQLKKIYIYIFFFLPSHTNYLSQRQQSFFFAFFTMWHPPFFHCVAPPFPSCCCVLLFSTPHTCLYIFNYAASHS